jgi:signal transduction histidine kinase/CheY-like chemotaxis protein/ligand-binding sensor domain-containing protein
MKTIHFLALLVGMLGGMMPGKAQVPMETLGVEQGLSQGFVTSMIQDKQGFMWFGTYDGLNRYDGYTVRRFMPKPFDPWSLQSSFITQLYEDDRPLLWVGTHQGLEVFDPLTERFFNLSLPEYGLPANPVEKIIVDKNGAVFVQIPSDNASLGLYLLHLPPDFTTRLRQGQAPLKGVLAEALQAPALINPPSNLLACLGDTMPVIVDQKGRLFGYSPTRRALQAIDPRQLPDTGTTDYNILWGKYQGHLFRWKQPDGRDSVPPGEKWLSTVPIQRDVLGIWFYPHGPFFQKNTSAPIDFDFTHEKEQILSDPGFLREFTKIVDYSEQWNNVALVDRRGAIWVGTGGLGVRKINPRQLAFGGLLAGRSVSSLRELPDGRIWVRLYSEESIVINPATGQKETPPWKLNTWLSEVFTDSRGDYWLIESDIPPFTQKRLLKYSPKTAQLFRFPVTIPFINGVTEKIFEDRDGNIWIAANQGQLFRSRQNSSELDHFSYAALTEQDPSSLRITAINQDKTGTIWLGTNRGLIRMADGNTASPKFSFLKHHPDNPKSLSINWVTSICLDPINQNILWLGTRGGGLNCLNLQNLSFSFISETPNGLPDNVVYCILPDNNGNLWCSTNRGLCRFNPLKNTFVSYQEKDGLLSTEFNTNSALRTRDGRLWFGGVHGLNVFVPEVIQSNHLPPSIAITGIKVRGTARLPDGAGSLCLPFEENNVLFEFAALDFTNPSSNRFRHRLLGIDKDWVYDGTNHSANYAALPPGEYVLELQGATADSPWSTEPLVFHLIIQPPWYRSWLAYFVYFFAFIVAIWGIIRYREKIFRLEHTAEINQRESQRLKAFEGVKNQFFANVAHELRTPLTVILGLAKRLQKDAKKEEIEESAHNIAEQGNTLLHLTNQILDLAKLESHQFSLNLSNGNISQFVRQHALALAPLAESKALKLVIKNELPVVWMDFDPTQIQKVLNNLIANAIRHSMPGGSIRIETTLEHDDTWLKLSVEDEGEGIAPNDLPHIFDRFYQGSQSNTTNTSGLGLTLTRDLVQLMGGEVQVSSTLGKGTLFTIFLPISNLAPRQLDFSENLPVKNAEKTTIRPANNPKLPLLLILEDNEAVANFLQRCLQDHFRLEMAADGAAGIAKALELIPDLILSDVAMPKKDGFEVASTLKNDVRTSHIPIVMLTAKVEQRDRLEGQRRGANAYLTKPFEEAELLQVLHNLLHLQQQWKRRYAEYTSVQPVVAETELTAEDLPLEDAFMQALFAAFEANYTDDSFNLDRLCRLLGMSSSQLDRKLKVLSDQTPMQMLRSFRLQKAKAMLQAIPKPNIKDVCFRAGFKSPSHFSRAFSEEFGFPPSEV